MKVTLDIRGLQYLFGTKAVEINAKMSLAQLPIRQRNMLIKYLRNGYIASSIHYNTGWIANQMLKSTGMFYMWGKVSGYVYVAWNAELPPGVEQKLIELCIADDTATTIQGGNPTDRNFKGGKLPAIGRYGASCLLRTLKPAHHVPAYLAEYTSSPVYQAAVDPWIAFVEFGGTIEIEVKQRVLTR